MARTVLAIYLALHTLIGPWLCCCSLTSFAVPSSAAAGSGAERLSKTHSCCQSKGELSQPGNKGESGTPTPSRPHPCPCQKNHADLASLLPTSTPAEEVLLQRGFHGWPMAVFSLGTIPAAGHGLIARFDGNALPFLTADDLLRMHHVLRC